MLQTTFSRRGGKARSVRKTLANRAKARAYWVKVQNGQAEAPRRHRKPPPVDEIIRKLTPYCRKKGITQLELFGSTARGKARPGSDVDLIATFCSNPSLDFFSMEDEMKKILGSPVHLFTFDSIREMPNHIRRQTILKDARVIYRAQEYAAKS